jgi:hypothetical protein
MKCKQCGRMRGPEDYEWDQIGRRRSGVCCHCKLAGNQAAVRCTKCGQVKPPEEFYWKVVGVRRMTYCRTCQGKITEKWRQDNRSRSNQTTRRNAIKRKYGLTPEAYMAYFEATGFRCEGCGRKGRPARYQDLSEGEVQLHLDHDHVTGKIRGVLCTNCNNGVGRFRDDPKLLRRLADYLERN